MSIRGCIWLLASTLTLGSAACDACRSSLGDPARGGGSGVTAGIGEWRSNLGLSPGNSGTQAPKSAIADGPVPDLTQPGAPQENAAPDLRRWSLDTSFEYREFKHFTPQHSFAIVQSGHDQHAYLRDYFAMEHIGYVIDEDLAVGVGAGFRQLQKLDVDNAARLGQHETSQGASDPEFDVKYRFKHQSECFPCDLALFGSAKTNFGDAHNRRPTGELFETEDQPGSGSWNGNVGVAASRGWDKWGVSSSASYTYKGEGSQHFKEGDVTRLSLSASRLLSPVACAWKLYGSMGLQGLLEDHARIHGIKDSDHGGRFMYILPGIAAKPSERWVVSLTTPIPVVQKENGTHQRQRYGVQLGVGVRF